MPKRDEIYEPEGGIKAYKDLPRSLQFGVQAYIELGQVPGDFLCAVIQNDLRGAIRHADTDNKAVLPEIVGWFHYEAPGHCWGSEDKMARWVLDREKDPEDIREKAKARLPR